MICLDSSFLVDRFRDREYAQEYLDGLADDVQIYVPAIVLHELFTGALRSDHTETIPEIKRELSYLPVAPFDSDAAEEAARIRATLADRGDLINKLDLLIAGTARQMGATVVAVDRDFHRVPDLDTHNPKPDSDEDA